MKTLVFLFEYYEDARAEYHAEYVEYMAETESQAKANLIDDYPHARILNSYIHTRSLEAKQ